MAVVSIVDCGLSEASALDLDRDLHLIWTPGYVGSSPLFQVPRFQTFGLEIEKNLFFTSGNPRTKKLLVIVLFACDLSIYRYVRNISMTRHYLLHLVKL